MSEEKPSCPACVPRHLQPETNQQLLLRAYEKSGRAHSICKAAVARGQFKDAEIWELLLALRAAVGAAQEMENRSRGCPPPKVGI